MRRKIINKMLYFLVICMLFTTIIFSSIGCEKWDKEKEEDNPSAGTSFTIQYTDDMGLHELNVKYDNNYHLESIPSRFGYVFLGLFDAKENGVQYVDENGNSLAPFRENTSMTLYPVFAPIEYTIILNFEGAPVVGDRFFKASYGSRIVDLPINLTIPNKVFTGWYTKPNKDGKQIADQYGNLPDKSVLTEDNFDLSTSNGFVNLYAGFKGQEYNVVFYYDYGKSVEKIVEHGTDIADIVINEKVNGQAVISWSEKENDINKEMLFTSKIKGEMVLYACEYAPVIDFETLGGEKLNSLVRRAGDSIVLPTPIKDNYKFLGWQDANGQDYSITSMPSDSIKLFAKWQAIISFDERGGSLVDDISLSQGSKLELPNTEKSGHIFAGWYDENGNEYTQVFMPAVSIKLQAKYYKVLVEKRVLITDEEYKRGAGGGPSIDRSIAVDIKEIYDKGVRKIKITSHCDVAVKDGSVSKPQYAFTSWYCEKQTSDAHLVWENKDEVTENWTYRTYVHCGILELRTSTLSICFWSTHDDVWYEGASSFSDFWIEIEYPDMSTLC